MALEYSSQWYAPDEQPSTGAGEAVVRRGGAERRRVPSVTERCRPS